MPLAGRIISRSVPARALTRSKPPGDTATGQFVPSPRVCGLLRPVSPDLHHTSHGRNGTRSTRKLIQFSHELLDLVARSEHFRDNCISNVLHGYGRDQLDLAARSRWLDHVHLDSLKTGFRQKLRQSWSDVGVAAAPPHGLGVEFHITPEGQTVWIAETTLKVDILSRGLAARGVLERCRAPIPRLPAS